MEQKQNNSLGYAPIGKLLKKFAIPAIISMLVNAIYNIVDQIFIGQGVGYCTYALATMRISQLIRLKWKQCCTTTYKVLIESLWRYSPSLCLGLQLP